MGIQLKAMGFVRTDAEELPRHWNVSDVQGTLVIDEEYSEGLRDVEPGQRLVVIFQPDQDGPRSGSDAHKEDFISRLTAMIIRLMPLKTM